MVLLLLGKAIEGELENLAGKELLGLCVKNEVHVGCCTIAQSCYDFELICNHLFKFNIINNARDWPQTLIYSSQPIIYVGFKDQYL